MPDQRPPGRHDSATGAPGTILARLERASLHHLSDRREIPVAQHSVLPDDLVSATKGA